MTRYFGLSKSKISSYEQCPRRLWQQTHTPERGIVDDTTQMSFNAGHAVGDLACALIPRGVMVEVDPDMKAALMRTKALVTAADRPIFEATFEHKGVLVRVDILTPEKIKKPKNKQDDIIWHIAEVKSSGSAKPYHHGDLATQLWVIRNNGLNISSVAIRHIDTKFTLKKSPDKVSHYKGLFKDADLLDAVHDSAQGRADDVITIRKMLAGDEPICATGTHCNNPFSCEFINHCSAKEPKSAVWPIEELPFTGAKLAAKWADENIYDIRDLPDDAGLNDQHSRIRRALIDRKPYRNAKGVKADTKKWGWPWIWLDFETIAFAIPKWIGTRPYQQIAFQFSAHVENKNGDIKHIEALDLSGDDPRTSIAKALAKLPKKGTVIAWNAGFERACLRNLAAAVPQYESQLLSLAARTVDLLPVTKAHYYHPNQRGSFSIKSVLPTLAPHLDYGDLEVKDGGNAQAAYMEATADNIVPKRKAAIDAALKNYCARDTWAMVEIYRKLII